jgi:tetratricopeptide (TPR) repeat protein
MASYAVRCPTCGLVRRGRDLGLREERTPEEVTQYLQEQAQQPPRARWFRRRWPGRPGERVWNLVREHLVAAGLLLGTAVLLGVLGWFSLARVSADPLARTEELLREQAARQQQGLSQVRAGEKAVAGRNYAQAHAALTRALELGADAERLRYLTGRCALELQRYRGAVRDLSLALGYRPEVPSPWVLRGRAFEGLGHYQAALTDFQQAVSALSPQSPDLAEVHYAIARVHTRLGDLPQALEALEQALRSGLKEAGIYLLRGDLRAESGEEEGALADYGRALAADPGLAPAYLKRGMLLVRLGRYEPAVADLSRALELGLTAAEAYSHRGVAYAHLSQTEAARRDLETAVRLGAFEARPVLRAVSSQEQALRRLAASRPHLSSSTPRQAPPRRPRRR